MGEQDRFETGAIAFLDILGFKGLWNRKKPDEIIAILEESIVKLHEAYKNAQENIKNNPNLDHNNHLMKKFLLNMRIP